MLDKFNSDPEPVTKEAGYQLRNAYRGRVLLARCDKPYKFKIIDVHMGILRHWERGVLKAQNLRHLIDEQPFRAI